MTVQITALPTPPSRSDPANFAVRGDAFLGALPLFQSEANLLADEANSNTVAAAASAATAAGQVVLATAQAERSELAADISVGAANYKGDYNAMTTYLVGQSVTYLGVEYVAKKTNLGITPIDGLDWLELSSNTGLVANPIIEEFAATRTFAVSGISITQVINIDANKELLTFQNGHVAVYNKTTKTLGAILSYTALTSVKSYATVIDANRVLICYYGATPTLLRWRVLSISGETLTAGAETTLTLPTDLSNEVQQISIGSSYVTSGFLSATGEKFLVATTVSGTTVTVGTRVTLTGAGNITATIESVTSSVLLATHTVTNTGYATPVSVSGTTLTIGTQVTVACLNNGQYSFGLLSTGRFLVAYGSSGATTLITVTGTVATASATFITEVNTSISDPLVVPFLKDGPNVILPSPGSLRIYRIRDNAGTINSAEIIYDTSWSGIIQTPTAIFYVSSSNLPAKFSFLSGEILAEYVDGLSANGFAVTGLDRYRIYRTNSTIFKGENFITSSSGPFIYCEDDYISYFYAPSKFNFAPAASTDGTSNWVYDFTMPANLLTVNLTRYTL